MSVRRAVRPDVNVAPQVKGEAVTASGILSCMHSSKAGFIGRIANVVADQIFGRLCPCFEFYRNPFMDINHPLRGRHIRGFVGVDMILKDG